MVELSPETRFRLEVVFHGESRLVAARMIEEECGNNLPFLENLDARGLERYRFAVLKLSGGDLARLRTAIELAKMDWRDLLIAAGFASDVQAHEHWNPGEEAF
jgi:hypothetical protein